MGVQHIVDRALEQGYLTPTSEATLDRICRGHRALEVEEYEALVRLHRAVDSGRVLAPERKHCLNVMEELVWDVVVESFSLLQVDHERFPDMGDVAAYALNRLKPLYATTEEGAEYQRTHANRELLDEIKAQVAAAMDRSVQQPQYHPERKPLQTASGGRTVAAIVAELKKGMPRME